MQGDFSNDSLILNAPFLYKGFAGWPSYSPNGSQIVFTADADTNECFICIVDVKNPNHLHQITRPEIGAKRPSWHPDGSKIAYNLNNETIRIYDMKSQKSELYLSEAVRGKNKLIHPCYAPDGKSILVASLHKGGPQREEVLYRLNPDAENPIEQITQYPQVCAGRPAVSPDNKDVVFAGHADFFNQLENRLWKVSIPDESFKLEEGDDATCHGRCPAYSPDGKWISCVSTRPLKKPIEITPMSVWMIRSDGSEAYRLTNDSLLPTHMSWSPDQEKLAVTGAFGLQLIHLPNIFRRK